MPLGEGVFPCSGPVLPTSRVHTVFKEQVIAGFVAVVGNGDPFFSKLAAVVLMVRGFPPETKLCTLSPLSFLA